MELPTILPEWRTPDVLALCVSMREAQDFSALPILADALQDAGCPEGSPTLDRLRNPTDQYAVSAGLVACVYDASCHAAVEYLVNFCNKSDCPLFEITVAAAVGERPGGGYGEDGESYELQGDYDGDGGYLYFHSHDAHAAIPAEFWDAVQAATGKRIPAADRVERFTCSC